MNAAVQPTLSLEPEVISGQTALPALAEPRELQASAPTPLDMLNAAVARGADMAVLEKLMDLQERWDMREAKKAYDAAFARFKALNVRIVKRKRVFYESSKGTVDYLHATLADVVDAVSPGLGANGLSYRWNTEQREGGVIHVTCILTHERGHSESTSLFGGADNSGSKNAIQAVASTVTYLKRDTLKSVTGTAEQDDDDDGRGAGNGAPKVELITPEQLADIEALISEVGADRNKFLVYARVSELAEIEAKDFKAMCTALRARAQAAPNQKKA